MANRPAPFKQVDLTRAIKGAAYITPEAGIIIIAKGEPVTSTKGSIDLKTSSSTLMIED